MFLLGRRDVVAAVDRLGAGYGLRVVKWFQEPETPSARGSRKRNSNSGKWLKPARALRW